MRRLIHVQAATGDQIHAALSLELTKQAGIIGFRVRRICYDWSYYLITVDTSGL
jgi:hypothetical protein